MPRYYFNVRDGVDHIDQVGTELASNEEARFQAIKSAGDLLRDAGNGGPFDREWSITVLDESGTLLYLLKFKLTEARPAP